jgi:acetolactate synthase small subunit
MANKLKKTKEITYFWSIEFVDHEGDTVIKHVTGSSAKIKQIIDDLAKKNISAIARQIMPPASK